MSATATQRFTEAVRIDQGLTPLSRAANDYDTPWYSLRDYHKVAFILHLGAIAATGTLDVSVRQAKDDAGGAAKAITGKALTQLTGTDDDKIAVIEVDASELDVNGKFDHVSVRATVATDASLFGVLVCRHQPRYAPVGVTQLEEVLT